AFAPELRTRLADVQREVAALAFDPQRYEALRQGAARLDTLRHRLADLDARLAGLDDLRARVSGLDARLADLRRQHDDGRLFGDLLERRDAIKARIAALDFDSTRFEAVQAEHERLREVPAQHAALLAAREQRAECLVRRASLTERLAQLDADRAALARDLETVGDLDARRDAGKAALALAEAGLAEAVETHEGARDAVTRHALYLQRLSELAAQAANTEATARAARDEAALYRHLRTAFSRRGIPSLIIEETLPEIEEHANDLLGRLTDGQMHLQLRSLRDKKTGGTAETLDIILTDDQGSERPYETFSGGEAFRVNFALRVALSQLLARRSGVSVRTLVVDEGFGTQDPQGLQALVEAIRSVQDHFDKILVVTHLDELKEAFPVRIEVRKDPAEGSTFELIGA
ncbi:MAG TPA: SMC family ATPase, partial [Rhodothermales bacterium]|nr:SMC family ATPase [Rhodothermales bacterium]